MGKYILQFRFVYDILIKSWEILPSLKRKFFFRKDDIKMKTVFIRLSTIQDVRDFVNIVTSYNGEIDLSSGRYVVDGKSIMGIYSLDLLNPIKMIVHSDDCPELMEKLSRFIVKE